MRIIFVLLGLLLVAIVGVVVYDPFARNLPGVVAASIPDVKIIPPISNNAPGAVQTRIPVFDLVQVSPDGMAVIAGQGEPNATITVLDGERPIGTARIDQSGSWVLNPDKPLDPGNRTLALKMDMTVPEKGPQQFASDKSVVILVPERGSGQPATVAMIDGKTGATRIMQRASNFQGIAIDLLEQPVDKPAILRGQANKPGKVRLYAAEKMMGEAAPDSNGQWAIAIPSDAATTGLKELRVDLVDDAGRVVARAAVNVADMMAAQEDQNPGQGKVVVIRPGNNLWRIAMAAYGDGYRYHMIFEANKDQIKDPDLIYPGQVFSLPVK